MRVSIKTLQPWMLFSLLHVSTAYQSLSLIDNVIWIERLSNESLEAHFSRYLYKNKRNARSGNKGRSIVRKTNMMFYANTSYCILTIDTARIELKCKLCDDRLRQTREEEGIFLIGKKVE